MNLKNIAIAVCLLVGTTLFAQEKPRKDAVKERTEAMIEELGLDSKQAAQYRELVQAKRSELKALRQAEREGAREKTKELRDKHDESLKEILTPEQWETYQAKKEAKRAKSKERVEKIKEERRNEVPAEGEKMKNSINGK